MTKQLYFKQFSYAYIQFSSFWPIRCYHSRLELTLERWQWRGNPHSPKFQHFWNFTIRLFRVISTTVVGEVLSLRSDAVGVFYSLSRLDTQAYFCTKINPFFVWKSIVFLISRTDTRYTYRLLTLVVLNLQDRVLNYFSVYCSQACLYVITNSSTISAVRLSLTAI